MRISDFSRMRQFTSLPSDFSLVNGEKVDGKLYPVQKSVKKIAFLILVKRTILLIYTGFITGVQ